MVLNPSIQTTVDELLTVLEYTVRKAQANGKGMDYIPALFENELMDRITRETISERGCVAHV